MTALTIILFLILIFYQNIRAEETADFVATRGLALTRERLAKATPERTRKREALLLLLRDWSLITGRGGLQNSRGWISKVLPLQKGGGKVLAMLKGAQQVLG